MSFSLNDVLPDTPENRRLFLDELHRMEERGKRVEEVNQAAGVAPSDRPDRWGPPVLLAARNGQVGLVRPVDCHWEAFVIAQFARGSVEMLNCQAVKLRLE